MNASNPGSVRRHKPLIAAGRSEGDDGSRVGQKIMDLRQALPCAIRLHELPGTDAAHRITHHQGTVPNQEPHRAHADPWSNRGGDNADNLRVVRVSEVYPDDLAGRGAGEQVLAAAIEEELNDLPLDRQSEALA